MTYYPDLSPYISSNASLLAVGWLTSSESYPRGELEPEFFRKLMELLVDPWQPAVAGGGYRCEFCKFTGGPGRITYEGSTVSVGSSNLFVPGNEAMYVCPSLVAHYVDAHEYSPPVQFQNAVRACPEMRSVPYLRLLRAHGIHRLTPP
jgi:hypothetical protein